MRQTSRAVALLLALDSANAADPGITPQISATVGFGGDYETVFNPSVSAAGAPNNELQLNSRTAGYTGAARVYNRTSTNTGTGWTAATFRKAKIINVKSVTTTLALSTVSVAGSGCVQCIRGLGVWCSRTYSYLSTNSTDQFQATLTTVASNMVAVSAANADQFVGDAKDQGSCCESVINFNVFVGTKKDPVFTPNVNNTATSTAGTNMVSPACVAIMNANAAVSATADPNTHSFGASRIDNTKTIRSGWWCSNGLYKTVQTATSAIVMNSQQTIQASQNKRLELALVGCPNAKKMCGYDNTTPVVATLLSSSKKSWAIAMPATGMTVLNKCSWVAYSVESPPVFVMSEANSLGLAGSNWTLHAMEYTASVQTELAKLSVPTGTLSIGLVSGLQQVTDAVSPTNLTPLFTMPDAAFSTLRTWYGEGAEVKNSITQQAATWNSPGQAPIINTKAASKNLASVQNQLYGNVANVPVSSSVTQGTSTDPVGNFNYGTYNNVGFDLRQMRYFPAKVAQTSHASGVIAAAKYTTALSAYSTAKTTWDNYVAILEKNSSQDAFAALFSPPKAPTVPPLPNKPWVPAAYSGYTRATAQEVAGWSANFKTYKAVASPTASQIWTNLAAAQTVGGWGSFTASIFTFRNGWGKSFGTIGYSGDADSLSISDVWNYQWTCTATALKTAALSTSTQCAPTYASPSAGSLATTVTDTAANTVNMVSMVSLWSTAMVQADETKQVWPSQNGLTITFSTGAWKSGIVGLTPITQPSPAADAKSLTGLAGAQALVASSAAALAVAAALY